jgi:cellulose biosynthesis protein BcsQ
MQKCGGRIGNFMDIGKTIVEYRPDSHGAEDYLALCREIIGRG